MDKKKAQKKAKTAADKTAVTFGSVMHVVLKVFVTILLIGITTSLLFACIFAFYVKNSLSKDLDISLDDMSLNLASTIYYTNKDGENQELATFHGKENRIWVDYENIPKAMTYAAVSIEDKRFYKHHGVDWYRTIGAFTNMFIAMRNDFGGSTITQQLIKNLTKEDDITVQRKLLEIFRALEFERKYTKEEIMQWYLNVIYLGQSCNGVGTASETYFGKDVWDLSIAECASIVAITNNPSKYDPYISKEKNKERRDLILYEMKENNYITYDEYKAAIAEEIVLKRSEEEQASPMTINSYYVETVIADVTKDLMAEKGIDFDTATDLLQNGGYQIYSCFDPEIQAKMDAIYEDPSNFPSVKSSKGQSIQSSAVLLDPYTGEIKALVGGVGKKEANLILNRATDTKRPPGSSFKPIAVYGPAVDQGLISPSTLVNDADGESVKLSGTTWYPKNADYSYRGIITIQTALTHSLNTVSAQILDKLTPGVSYKYLTERLGVESIIEADRDYAPLALGQLTYGITVREMAQAFDAFVNDGVFTYSRTYTKVTDSEGNVILDNPAETIVAFKANTAWTMSYMLSIAAAQGTGREATLSNMSFAGKTGSSSNYCDRWFVGFTPYYVCAVWTGYDTPEYMRVGSSNPAAVIWRKFMQSVHEGLENKPFKSPTLGAATNIFGDLKESPSPSPSEEPSESPEESGGNNSPSPSQSPSPSPSPIPPTPSTPVGEATNTVDNLINLIQNITIPKTR